MCVIGLEQTVEARSEKRNYSAMEAKRSIDCSCQNYVFSVWFCNGVCSSFSFITEIYRRRSGRLGAAY